MKEPFNELEIESRSSLEQVEEFHTMFNRPINAKPTITDDETNALRVRLLREEVQELEDALNTMDKKGVLDALTDIQYILDGSYLALGFYRAKDTAFSIVHQSNMKKLGPDGKPIIREDGKILKPAGWVPPDLGPLVTFLES